MQELKPTHIWLRAYNQTRPPDASYARWSLRSTGLYCIISSDFLFCLWGRRANILISILSVEKLELEPRSLDSSSPALSTILWFRRRDKQVTPCKWVTSRLDLFVLLFLWRVRSSLRDRALWWWARLSLLSFIPQPPNSISNPGQLLRKCRLLAIIASTCHSAWHLVGTQQMFVEPNRITQH